MRYIKCYFDCVGFLMMLIFKNNTHFLLNLDFIKNTLNKKIIVLILSSVEHSKSVLKKIERIRFGSCQWEVWDSAAKGEGMRIGLIWWKNGIFWKIVFGDTARLVWRKHFSLLTLTKFTSQQRFQLCLYHFKMPVPSLHY